VRRTFLLFVFPWLLALTPLQTGASYLPQEAQLLLPFPAGANIRISSGYSPSGGSSLHDGVTRTGSANDYYALDLVYDDKPENGLGEPVVAPLAGTVLLSGWASEGWANYGLRVVLSHDLGDGATYHTVYAHLNAIDPAITEGATVTRGQRLGDLGRSCQNALSCNSFSAPHLHFSVHKNASIGGSGTMGSYGGNAVVPEPFGGAEDLSQGQVIVSNNAQVEICGDGVCTVSEDNAGCPSDCPVCEGIPSQGRVIDDDDICFSRGGNSAYWYEADAGHGGHLWWTHTTDDAPPDDHAIWSLDFEEAGAYLVEAYVDDTWATAEQASYQIQAGGDVEVVVVNQGASSGWTELGVFEFSAGGDQWMRLDDNSGEAFALERQIVFDAIRLTPSLETSSDAGVDPGEGEDAGPDAPPDGGSGSQPDAGPGPQDSGQSDAQSDGEVEHIVLGEGDEARPGGCTCAGSEDGQVGLFGFALMLLAMGRVRRRRY
jgi:hypothetical protein